ncbi:MAG: zinc metallopeptidase [Verrucomicrobiae bacterium]|nr:zinc metallopeptidase [Verrucomicrobiae bacterium]
MIAPLAFSWLSPQITFALLIPVIIVAMIAQFRVKSTFNKYSRVRARSGVTGKQAARSILDAADIHDVDIEVTESFLGDHYDPTKKKLVLSHAVANSDSLASLGVAAHECGHAIQHKAAYAPLKARMAIVGPTMIASQLLPFIMIGGFIFGMVGPLLDLGIVIYAVLTVFQLITLPVEFDASRRAKIILQQMGMVTADEAPAVSTVLGAAAMTYVAAFLGSLFHLIHLLALRGSQRD